MELILTGGVIDYPRFLVSEMHFGKFPDPMKFQSWKVNFKTEVCSKTADPHLTMQWIKEVKKAKSIDELMTSRSIVGRTDFPDYDMLDAMIASTLKKVLDRHVRFLRRVSVEEQLAQKYDRFLRGRQIASVIYEHLRATRAYEAVQGLSDLYNIRLQNDNIQDFDVRWDQALLSASETPTEIVLEGLYKSELQDSVQLQTVLALYDQETIRNNGQPSYQRLEASGRLHVDQTMTQHELETWKESTLPGSNKEKSLRWRKSVNLISSTTEATKEKTTDDTQGKNLQKARQHKDRALLEEVTDSRAKTEVVKLGQVIIGILLHVRITSVKQNAFMARSAVFDMLRQKRSPAKSQRRVVRKDQSHY